MADITISYKGNTIASKTDNGTVTLDTAGTFCEQDITVDVYDQYYMPTEDTTPYLYRTTAGSEDVGGLKKVEKLVGGTVNFNQILNQESAVSKSFSADTSTYYGTISAGFSASFTLGHKYFIGTNCTRTISSNNHMRLYFTGVNGKVYVDYDNGQADGWSYSICESLTSDTMTGFFYNNYSGKKGFSNGDSVVINNSMAVDLTQMFGSTIADYLYNLDLATAGDGLAKLQEWGFFTKPYYPYNAGELVSVRTSASVTCGINVWDEEYEAGAILSTTGIDAAQNNSIRTTNYIKVIPSATYYFKTPQNLKMRYYDGNKNYLGYLDKNGEQNANNNTRTMPDNCEYIRFCLDIATYGNDICINLTNTAINGNYYAYSGHTYPLQSTDLRGILSLDASNKLTYTGDEYTHEGVVTRNYAIVDLGTLTWSYNSNYGFMGATLSGLKSWTRNSICQTYVNSLITSVSLLTDKKYYMTGTDIRIMDTDYTDATTFTSAMSGVYLVYELDTATTESANPFAELQTISNLGTEQFVDGRTVEMPVGHQSLYNEPRSTDTLKS